MHVFLDSDRGHAAAPEGASVPVDGVARGVRQRRILRGFDLVLLAGVVAESVRRAGGAAVFGTRPVEDRPAFSLSFSAASPWER